ncbi:MFS transporter [Sandaracinobacteroides hominis]|uniref:MFS transporter n=1 Tax=Sandaracinobacteroides hominis TaxID=2780086 RepID=UPI0018F6FAA2|nr:MFS transporter [Sandaracinobacteroides hominis]
MSVEPSRRLTRQEAAWSLTEAANEPFFNLVQRYVFAPYFAGTLAATAAEGAAVWGFALGAAGLAIAILAPVLGSIADSGSRLKPWLAGAGMVGFVASVSLWFAAPGVSLLPVAIAVFAGSVATELMNQFGNAFLPVAARREKMGLLSGLSFGISQLVGMGVLLVVLAVSSSAPAFLADIPSSIDRLAGPLAAASMLIFLTPFLLVAKDRVSDSRASVTQGLADLKATLAEAWKDRNMRMFLIARMVSADGMAIVFSFGAVLAAASFGWKADTLARFGLVITTFGVIGGFAGSWIDGRIGAKRLSLLGLLLMAFGSASVLLTDAERLFGFPTGIALGVPLASPQEWGFMASGAVIAAGAAFAIAGMRTMMAMLAPPEKLAAYFGLYSFVGKATAFVGPTLVGLIATATGSVRPGIGVAILFLLLSSAALFAVRSPIRQVD